MIGKKSMTEVNPSDLRIPARFAALLGRTRVYTVTGPSAEACVAAVKLFLLHTAVGEWSHWGLLDAAEDPLGSVVVTLPPACGLPVPCSDVPGFCSTGAGLDAYGTLLVRRAVACPGYGHLVYVASDMVPSWDCWSLLDEAGVLRWLLEEPGEGRLLLVTPADKLLADG